MRRKSSKSAMSNSESSIEPEFPYDNLPLDSNHKMPSRRCQCCQSKRKYDFLRDQRESREKMNLMKRNKEIETKMNEKNIREIQEIEKLRKENWNPNFDDVNLSLKKEDEGYLIMEREKIEQIDDKILCYDSQLSVENKNSPRKQLSPHYKKQLLIIKSQLSSILEAENSTSLVNEFNRVSNFPQPIKLSISVNINSKIYSKTWTQKQQIQGALDHLQNILY